MSINVKMSSFSSRLKAIRLSLFGLAREDFADRLGIPEATIRSWETGRTHINASSLSKLSDALNAAGLTVTKEWLTNGEGKSPFNDKSLPDDFSEKTIFFSSYQDAILFKVEDHENEPLYSPGDLIGAIPTNLTDIANMSIVVLEGKKRKREIKKLVKTKEGLWYLLPATDSTFSEAITLKPYMKAYKIIWFKGKDKVPRG